LASTWITAQHKPPHRLVEKDSDVRECGPARQPGVASTINDMNL
jgi:hypothetical protein